VTTAVLFLMLLLALIIAIFAGQNPQAVHLQFFAWELETSLVAVIVGASAAGGLLVGTVGLFRQLYNRLRGTDPSSKLRQVEDERNRLQQELECLQSKMQDRSLSQSDPEASDDKNSADE